MSTKLERGGGPMLGRVHWDAKHCTNWMLFDNITQYRQWARDMRKARPEVKCEYALLSIPSPASILNSAQAEAAHRAQELWGLL